MASLAATAMPNTRTIIPNIRTAICMINFLSPRQTKQYKHEFVCERQKRKDMYLDPVITEEQSLDMFEWPDGGFSESKISRVYLSYFKSIRGLPIVWGKAGIGMVTYERVRLYESKALRNR